MIVTFCLPALQRDTLRSRALALRDVYVRREKIPGIDEAIDRVIALVEKRPTTIKK